MALTGKQLVSETEPIEVVQARPDDSNRMVCPQAERITRPMALPSAS